MNSPPADLQLRPLEPEDARPIYATFRDPRGARTTLALPSYEYPLSENWARQTRPGQHRLVAVLGGRPVGQVGLQINQNPRQRHLARLGLMVDADHWGQGIGGSLLAAALDLADNWLNLDQVQLGVLAHNPTAQRLYERHGFQPIGAWPRAVVAEGRRQDERLMCRDRPNAPGAAPALDVADLRPGPIPRPPDDLVIRPVDRADLAGLHRWWRHPTHLAGADDWPSLSRAELSRRLEEPSAGEYRLVAVMDDRVVGLGGLTVGASPRRAQTARLALHLDPTRQGRGIGHALLAALVDLADNWFNLARLEIALPADRPDGIRRAAGLGFNLALVQRQARFGAGRWQDEVILYRLRGLPSLAIPLPAGSPALQSRPHYQDGPAVIRPFEADDLAALAALSNRPEIGRTTGQFPAQETTVLAARRLAPQATLFRYVAEVAGRPVGQLVLHRPDNPRRAHSAGLGMMVDPDWWGQGIGSQLMAAALDLADRWLGLTRVALEVNVDNPAGRRLYEKFGFGYEGVIPYHLYGAGRWAHSYVMARIRPPVRT